MPELPEVEVLVRNLAPMVVGKRIREVEVRRRRVLGQISEKMLQARLRGAKITGLSRRGKYLLFNLRPLGRQKDFTLLGHLGMTGRMYVAPKGVALPKHTAVTLDFGAEQMIYEDTRYFGQLTLDTNSLERLGPEPLQGEFTAYYLATALRRSTQAIKVKMLDQSVVAGLGNIYASEVLFLARISPRLAAKSLSQRQITALRQAIRAVLDEAIRLGCGLPLDFEGGGNRDGLFYYGTAATAAEETPVERFRVYDRRGQPCIRCGRPIERIVQAARSTFFCPNCQREDD